MQRFHRMWMFGNLFELPVTLCGCIALCVCVCECLSVLFMYEKRT